MRKVWAGLAVGAVALLCVIPTGSHSASAVDCPPVPSPQSMSDPAFYAYVNTYDSTCASHDNWGRTFPDQTLSQVDGTSTVAVTTSTALGGAVASIKVNGVEFIASGGHGSALQYAFHPAADFPSSSEANNPTQAGTILDDAGPAPYHGASTSALYQHETVSGEIRTNGRLAMYLPRWWTGFVSPSPDGQTRNPAVLQPASSPWTYGLAPYWLASTVAPVATNAFRLHGTLTAEVTSPYIDGVLIAYLQRQFTRAYHVDLATGATTLGEGVSPRAAMRCTDNDNYCLGMLAVTTGYVYTAAEAPSEYNGWAGSYTIQVTSSHGGPYETVVAVGDRARVADTLRSLS